MLATRDSRGLRDCPEGLRDFRETEAFRVSREILEMMVFKDFKVFRDSDFKESREGMVSKEFKDYKVLRDFKEMREQMVFRDFRVSDIRDIRVT